MNRRISGWPGIRPLVLVVAGPLCLGAVLSAQAPTDRGRLGLSLTEITAPWTGDLDGMVQRRMVRVLTAYSKTQTSSTMEHRAERRTTRVSCSKTN